jgi:hypothetical protein
MPDRRNCRRTVLRLRPDLARSVIRCTRPRRPRAPAEHLEVETRTLRKEPGDLTQESAPAATSRPPAEDCSEWATEQRSRPGPAHALQCRPVISLCAAHAAMSVANMCSLRPPGVPQRAATPRQPTHAVTESRTAGCPRGPCTSRTRRPPAGSHPVTGDPRGSRPSSIN